MACCANCGAGPGAGPGWIALSWLAVAGAALRAALTSAVMMERQIGRLIRGREWFPVHQHWVPWWQVSPYVPLAMVAGEDQKFPFHHGFDFDSIQDAMDAADEGERLRGASTISQQTAKNLFLWNGRSFVRKGLEAYFTVLIELTWPKRRILEVYMNIAELGNGIYGVGRGGGLFFHAAPAHLAGYQAARLAAVLPNPRRLHADRPSPYVLRHAEWTRAPGAAVGRGQLSAALKPCRLIPAAAAVDDADDRQHHRHLDQHADDRGQRGTGLKAEQADRRGDRQLEEVAGADEGRGACDPMGILAGQPVQRGTPGPLLK